MTGGLLGRIPGIDAKMLCALQCIMLCEGGTNSAVTAIVHHQNFKISVMAISKKYC